jgi:hypothetical protein
MSDALPASWATPAEAPEPFREHLVQHEDGPWVLNIDVDKDPRVLALANAKERLKNEAKTWRSQAEPWKAIGKQPADVLSALEELELLRTKQGEGDSALQSRITQVNTQWEGKLKEKDEHLSSAYAQLDELLVDDAAVKAILAEKGVVELLLPHVKSQSRVSVEGGKRKAVVVGKDGEPRIADVHGNPMDFAGLVKEMKKNPVFAVAFEGEAPAGSGARPSNSNGSPSAKSLADLRTDTQKTAFIKEHGLQAYQRLVDNAA